MKKIVLKILGIITIIMFLLQVPVTMAASTTDLKNQQKANEKKIEEQEQKKEEVTAEKNKTVEEVEDITNQITNYESQISELNSKIDELNTKIADSQNKLNEAQNKYDEQEELLEARLVVSYEEGETSYLDVLLASESITDFISNYYLVTELATSDAELLDSIQKQKEEIEQAKTDLENSKKELDTIASSLRTKGYLVTDLTDDIIAKEHVRYMVGGHPTVPIDEKLFLFEFPNTKNALGRFLETLGDLYSITLFHFRISDLEFCSVLCGFDISEGSGDGLDSFIRKLNYPVTEVSSNTPYQQFLS